MRSRPASGPPRVPRRATAGVEDGHRRDHPADEHDEQDRDAGPVLSFAVRSELLNVSVVSSSVDFASSAVVGGSFTAFTVTLTMAVAHCESGVPLSQTRYVKLAGPL